MRGTVLYGPRDIRFEDRETPKIVEPTDAIIRIAATCVCGSDLWPYRGLQPINGPTPMGHEYCGIVEEVGSAVRSVKPGQFVIGSFATSDNTCPNCQYGYQSSCVHREFMTRAQAPVLRVPLADGTLVPTPGVPSDDLVPSLLTTSDVLGTGWFAADAANVKPGSTVAVVGDGAVGLLGVLSAKQMGAERIIAMSRHETRQKLAREFGATDIVTERGDEGVARIKDLTKGIGADSVLECVGTQESMMQAIRSTRPGGYVCYVGVPHGVELDGRGTVLRPRPPARRPRPGAALPARADRPGAGPEDQPRQGVRPDAAARPGGGGLPGDGRAPRDQDAAAPLTAAPTSRWCQEQTVPNENGSFTGRVAFVTGAANGIGRATAIAFAREGAHVAVADVSEQGNQETARMIEELGGRALAVRCDVTRTEDVKAALDRTVETFGRFDFAFNNAGVEQPIMPAADITEEEWDRIATSTFAACSCA